MLLLRYFLLLIFCAVVTDSYAKDSAKEADSVVKIILPDAPDVVDSRPSANVKQSDAPNNAQVSRSVEKNINAAKSGPSNNAATNPSLRPKEFTDSNRKDDTTAKKDSPKKDYIGAVKAPMSWKGDDTAEKQLNSERIDNYHRVDSNNIPANNIHNDQTQKSNDGHGDDSVKAAQDNKSPLRIERLVVDGPTNEQKTQPQLQAPELHESQVRATDVTETYEGVRDLAVVPNTNDITNASSSISHDGSDNVSEPHLEVGDSKHVAYMKAKHKHKKNDPHKSKLKISVNPWSFRNGYKMPKTHRFPEGYRQAQNMHSLFYRPRDTDNVNVDNMHLGRAVCREDYLTMLFVAINEEDTLMISYALDELGSNEIVLSNGITPLNYALQNNRHRAAAMLAARGGIKLNID